MKCFIMLFYFSNFLIIQQFILITGFNQSLRASSSSNVPLYSIPGKPYKVVCYYYAVEAWYRTSRGMFLPEDIDPRKCTHINYAYAVLNSETLLIEPHDQWAEIDNRFYERVLSLKEINHDLKIVLSLGGWSEQSEKFSILVSDRLNRKAFTDHVTTFLLLHGFDGLDLAWFYPVCWDGDCQQTPIAHSEDRDNFAHLIHNLKDAFDRVEPRLLLTATVSGDTLIARQAYDFAALGRLDYINVMAFDYVAHWHQITGHQAPLFSQPGFPFELSANSSVALYINKGISRRKIVLGVPAFGRSFTLVDPSEHGLGAAVKGPGLKGEFTLAEGLLAFYEICDRVQKKSWKLIGDPNSNTFYTYSTNQWASFDHPLTIASKAEYVKENDLGGMMLWDIDRDDFHGKCFGRKFPLLSAINSVLFQDNSVGNRRKSD